MDNISLYTHINSLPAELKEQVWEFVNSLKSKKDQSKKQKNIREYGSLKGKISLSPDFDAPLEDFKEYSE